MNKTIAERSKIVQGRVSKLRVSEILEGKGVDLIQDMLDIVADAKAKGRLDIAANTLAKLLPYAYSKPATSKAGQGKPVQGVTINLIDGPHSNASYNQVLNELSQIKSENTAGTHCVLDSEVVSLDHDERIGDDDDTN